MPWECIELLHSNKHMGSLCYIWTRKLRLLVSSKYYELPDLEKAQEFYSEKLIAQDSLCTYYNHHAILKNSYQKKT